MELTESYTDLIEVDAEVLAISTDDLSTAGRIIASTSAPFPILYDPAAGAVRVRRVRPAVRWPRDTLDVRRQQAWRDPLEVRWAGDLRQTSCLGSAGAAATYRRIAELPLLSAGAFNSCALSANPQSSHLNVSVSSGDQTRTRALMATQRQGSRGVPLGLQFSLPWV